MRHERKSAVRIFIKKKKKSNILQCPSPFPFPVIPTLSGIIIAGGQWSSYHHKEKKPRKFQTVALL